MKTPDFRTMEFLPASRRCVIVGEVAQSHDGSLGTAHAYIDAIAEAGADAVKFQTHIAAAESTPGEPWRVRFSPQDATRFEYWKRMEFTGDQWLGLKRHADERGLLFLSSPFSVEAVELLRRVGVTGWKIASGEVRGSSIFSKIAETRLPVFLSTGMSPLSEIDAAVARIRARGLPLVVLQCTTAYPCPPESVGLNMIGVYRERYGCAVGLSDHSGTIFPGIVAASMEIAMLEVHVALSREMFGPDVSASVTTTEFRELVKGVRFVERMTAHPVDKDALAGDLRDIRVLFTKSVVARRDMPAGTLITQEDIAFRKPGTGIPEEEADRVLNRKLKVPVAANTQILEEHFE